MSEAFNVIFSGEVDDRFSKVQVRASLEKAMRLSPDKVERLFSGRVVTIKKNLSKEKASIFVKKLGSLGALAKAVPVSAPQKPTYENLSLVKKEEVDPSYQSSTRIMSDSLIREVGAQTSPDKSNFFNVLVSLLPFVLGGFLVLLGVISIILFSPFPDFTIKRGFVLGLVLLSFGAFRLLKQFRGS